LSGDRATLREKLSFGAGAVVYCVEMTLVLTYLMPFCTDVLHIDVAVIGIVMAAVKILDAVSDIVITNIADRTRTRWGKYRVWILNGIPLALVLLLLFSGPGFLQGEQAKIFWICGIYILLVPVLETAVSCPYMAMVATMSKDPKDRLDFSNARALGEAGAQMIVSMAVMPLILLFGGYREITGWRIMAAVIGGIIILCTLICFTGTKERIQVSYARAGGKQMTFREKCRPLKHNRPFWKLIGIILFFMAHFYMSSALFTYFCIYNLGHEEWVSPLLSLGFGTQIAVTVLLFYLGRRYEKRTLLLVGGGCIIVADLFLLAAGSFGGASVYQLLLGAGNGLFNGVAFAMLPDVTDYTEWKTGISLSGMISAIATFAMKMGGAASTLLASQVLAWAGYSDRLPVQSDFTLQMLRVCLPVLSIIFLAAAMLLSLRMKEVSGRAVAEYRKAIDARMITDTR
jgi:GPH family glycoside/pentoside/hexuronide:cation symporter